MEIENQRQDEKNKSQQIVTYEIKNFVGIFHNAFVPDYCHDIIKYYEHMVLSGYGKTRLEEGFSKTAKDDTQIYANEFVGIPMEHFASHFNKLFWEMYFPIYENEFACLKDSRDHSNYYYKIQKTKVGGGYHVWHYESSSRQRSNRLLAWTLYLNDVQDGGETEFLYYPMRIKPKTGTLVIWPAAFTHTHRGNPPISNEKYIVTGWTEF